MLPILIFALSLIYLLPFLRFSVMDLDEGIILQAAERILHGQVPYRDFFMFYTPGSAYLVATLFKAFGDSFLVARTSIAIAGAICTAITYVLARRVCSRNIALLAAALAMLNSFAYRFLVLHNWYATLFASLTIYAALRLWESQKSGWAFASGSLAAITTLIEQSKGAGLCLGLVAGYLILRFSDHARNVSEYQIPSLASGFVWPWLVTFGFFALNHGVRAMVEDWLWPLHHYAQANSVFYGYQNWSEATRETMLHAGPFWGRIFKCVAFSPGFLVPILPLIAVGWLGYEGLWRVKTLSGSSNRGYYVVISAALSGLLLSILAGRADIIHFMYLANLWYVVLGWILQDRPARSFLQRQSRPFLITYVCIAFGLMSFALLLNINHPRGRFQTRRGVVLSAADDTVIPYVQAHVAPGSDLLVYPYLPIYNYLTATQSPANVDFFQAGMSTPQQAQEIIASLKSHTKEVLLFEPEFTAKFASSWPKTPLTAIVNDPVADFIVRNYRICKALVTPLGWRLQFMVGKDDTCAQ